MRNLPHPHVLNLERITRLCATGTRGKAEALSVPWARTICFFPSLCPTSNHWAPLLLLARVTTICPLFSTSSILLQARPSGSCSGGLLTDTPFLLPSFSYENLVWSVLPVTYSSSSFAFAFGKEQENFKRPTRCHAAMSPLLFQPHPMALCPCSLHVKHVLSPQKPDLGTLFPFSSDNCSSLTLVWFCNYNCMCII